MDINKIQLVNAPKDATRFTCHTIRKWTVESSTGEKHEGTLNCTHVIPVWNGYVQTHQAAVKQYTEAYNKE
jgi:hypothetical protein